MWQATAICVLSIPGVASKLEDVSRTPDQPAFIQTNNGLLSSSLTTCVDGICSASFFLSPHIMILLVHFFPSTLHQPGCLFLHLLKPHRPSFQNTHINSTPTNVLSTATTTDMNVIVEQRHEKGFALISHRSRQPNGQMFSLRIGARIGKGCLLGTHVCETAHQEQGCWEPRQSSQFVRRQHCRKRSGSFGESPVMVVWFKT
jgi:hypothetical protein